MAFDPNNCLKFRALEDDCTIGLVPFSGTHGLHYDFSKDGINWQQDNITLNKGETCYVKGTTVASTESHWGIFNINKPAETISGNIMSLLDDGAGLERELTEPWCFQWLFGQCSNLKRIHGGLLPATKLSPYCYKNMFYNTTLTEIPEELLPALSVEYKSYDMMFMDCPGITELPELLLPATELGAEAYSWMFNGCTGLTKVPENFLRTEITLSVLEGYFGDPYYKMFSECPNLNEIHVTFKSWKTDNKTNTLRWVEGVATEGDFYCPEELEEIYDYSHIPEGWHLHRLAPSTPVKGGLGVITGNLGFPVIRLSDE